MEHVASQYCSSMYSSSSWAAQESEFSFDWHALYVVVDDVDSHIQRLVLATEDTYYGDTTSQP